MRKEILWNIKVAKTPLLIKKCSRCNTTHFYCSEKFRINAQKRKLDIWLIYRCLKCDNTFNLNIISRTKPELINKDLYLNLLNNDLTTVRKYAFSSEIAKRNKVELDLESIEYEINGNQLTLDDLIHLEEKTITIKIKIEIEIDLRISSIIRRGFGLSVRELKRMTEANEILISGNQPIKKHKVKDGDCILIKKESLMFILKTDLD